eukprot:229051-Ditylum_brightwellii.AAC.1
MMKRMAAAKEDKEAAAAAAAHIKATSVATLWSHVFWCLSLCCCRLASPLRVHLQARQQLHGLRCEQWDGNRQRM